MAPKGTLYGIAVSEGKSPKIDAFSVNVMTNLQLV